MPVVLTWPDVAARMIFAVVAGLVIGFNREERSQVVGLRTTTLVCLAAAIAMILANQLLNTVGKNDHFFTQMDVLRLPLGVLSGIGFIGGGAILKRGDIVLGVTTAATIWYMTIVGLCFGAGDFSLGVTSTGIALLLLWGLRRVDIVMPRKVRAALTICATRQQLPEASLRAELEQGGRHVVGWAITYLDGAQRYEARVELEWKARTAERSQEPEFLKPLAERPAVIRAEWAPKPVSG